MIPFMYDSEALIKTLWAVKKSISQPTVVINSSSSQRITHIRYGRDILTDKTLNSFSGAIIANNFEYRTPFCSVPSPENPYLLITNMSK
jgi:hypothetical protein